MKRKVSIGLAIVTIICLATALGLSLTKPEVPVVVGRVYQDNNYYGTPGALDEWDYPLAQCQVILRYVGCEGTTEIKSPQSSLWNMYFSNGQIVDQVQVDENGAYSFKLDWRPKGIFKGGINEDITAILYRLEILAPIQGFSTQRVIGSSQIRVEVAEKDKVILGPIFLLS